MNNILDAGYWMIIRDPNLGYNTRLYDGSFQEWSANKKLPVETSQNPGK